MTFPVKGKKYQRKVVFKRRAMSASNSSSETTSSHRAFHGNQRPIQPGFIIEEIENNLTEDHVSRTSRTPPITMSAKVASASLVPDLFTSFPFLNDFLNTETSRLQARTIQECLPLLSGLEPSIQYNDHGVPHLDRQRHIQFIHKTLGKLPAGYVSADASRPWMFYWALNSLVAMGEDISQYREPLISTVRPIQNTTGGFGGGNGQMSHLAPSYAVTLSLAMIGGEEGLDIIDRKAMWKWLGLLKQRDGSFTMTVGGEVDVRGALCASVIISLLDIPLDLPRESPAWTPEGATFWTNLPQFISRCQTMEGGISSRPDGEAHGGYTFCALAALCILGEPHVIIPQYLDLPRLISFLSARQYAPEGGYSGRTNKLVDGCYSHWVGGCWPLVEACLETGSTEPRKSTPFPSLYSREGIIRYILCCCQDQSPKGGLRDKPSHKSDSYHTCYVLAGLSSAQHKWHYNTSSLKNETSGVMTAPFHWDSEPVIEDDQLYDEVDRVGTMHPIFVIPKSAAEETRRYFASKGGF